MFRLWRSVKYEEVHLKEYTTVREAVAPLGAYLTLATMSDDFINLSGTRLHAPYTQRTGVEAGSVTSRTRRRHKDTSPVEGVKGLRAFGSNERLRRP